MLDVVKIPTAELFALLTAISFAAGLNLYATVAVLGLLARFGHLPLPPGIEILQSWAVESQGDCCRIVVECRRESF